MPKRGPTTIIRHATPTQCPTKNGPKSRRLGPFCDSRQPHQTAAFVLRRGSPWWLGEDGLERIRSTVASGHRPHGRRVGSSSEAPSSASHSSRPAATRHNLALWRHDRTGWWWMLCHPRIEHAHVTRDLAVSGIANGLPKQSCRLLIMFDPRGDALRALFAEHALNLAQERTRNALATMRRVHDETVQVTAPAVERADERPHDLAVNDGEAKHRSRMGSRSSHIRRRVGRAHRGARRSPQLKDRFRVIRRRSSELHKDHVSRALLPACHVDERASGVRRIVREQPEDGPRHLFGRPAALHRHERLPAIDRDGPSRANRDSPRYGSERPARSMGDEIGDGHFSAGDERRERRVQAKSDERSADRLDDPRGPKRRE
jgi:hypothetical protein